MGAILTGLVLTIACTIMFFTLPLLFDIHDVSTMELGIIVEKVWARYL
jgi:hypothetical protein